MYSKAIYCLFAIALGSSVTVAGMHQATQPAIPIRAEPRPVAMKPLTPDEIQKFIQHVPEVLTLWEAARAAEAKYAQTKNDETKAAFLKATFDFAERVMFHVNTPGQKDQLHDTQRYMVAYQSYDKVLDIDPAYEDKNCDVLRALGITGEILNKCPASGRVQTIENVYLGWGKTLPPLK